MPAVPKQVGNVVYLAHGERLTKLEDKEERLTMPRSQRQPAPISAPKRTNTREDKRRRFLIHIDRRMAEVKRQLDFLMNMAGVNYESTIEERRKIGETLDRWTQAVKTEFGTTERPKLDDFHLTNGDNP